MCAPYVASLVPGSAVLLCVYYLRLYVSALLGLWWHPRNRTDGALTLPSSTHGSYATSVLRRGFWVATDYKPVVEARVEAEYGASSALLR